MSQLASEVVGYKPLQALITKAKAIFAQALERG